MLSEMEQEITDGRNPLEYALLFEECGNVYLCELIDENPLLKDILVLCFKKDYTERPTACELLNHPFFKSFHADHHQSNHLNIQ